MRKTHISDAQHMHHDPLFVIEVFMYALIGGILPSLIWLWFWLHEEKHHEPRSTIALTFLMGMVAVFAVYPFEQWATTVPYLAAGSVPLFFVWAFFEEIAKFIAAYVIAFRTPIFDEPIDAFVYLMTAALGFAAMENTLFLLTPLLNGDTLGTIVTGNLRFMGSSLLHVVSSGAASVFLAYSFYMPRAKKRLLILGGLVSAIVLHTFFNFFIIETEKQSVFVVFSFVWFTIICLILLLERIKTVKKFINHI